MKISRLLLIIALTINTLFTTSLAKSAEKIKINKLPNWVIPAQVNQPEHIPVEEIDGGIYHLLVDNQIRAFDSIPIQYYSHFAKLITNQQGLESSAQINIEYDPNYQTIKLHSLNIIRLNRKINKQHSASVSTIQRETGMENLLYDGRHTMHIILDDVRVGDIIEYSYSKIGDNPVYNNIFSYSRTIQWTVPVANQTIRVLWNKKTPLNTQVVNSHKIIKERIFENYREYTISTNNAPTIEINSQIPDWYSPYAATYFSETNNWEDVVKWAKPLYKKSIEVTPELKHLSKKIKAETTDKNRQVVKALEFVQSEIRYLGIEIGANSHTPSKASETLNRRYGDCKDKAVLFISLLNLLGIEAYPVLVHTDEEKMIAEYPPNVNAFDHVLVKVMLNNEHYWLDPTRQYQSGHLKDIYQPDYGYALVVNNTSTALENMSNTTESSMKHIKDKFDLSSGGGTSVKFESETNLKGYYADTLKYQLASNGLVDLQKRYLDFYRGYYSDVETLQYAKVINNEDNGKITIQEKYLLSKLWEDNGDQQQYEATFYANSIYPLLNKPKQLKRNSPYNLVHPAKIKHDIEIQLKPGNWGFENEKETIDNSFFNFKYSLSYNKKTATLRLAYEYTSKSNHVKVSDFGQFLEARTKARDLLKYGINEYYENRTIEDNDTSTNQETNSTDSNAIDIDSSTDNEFYFNLIILSVFIVYLLLLCTAIITWRLEVRKRPVFEDEIFYPVSISKLCILSIITFGIYSAYWGYKNWKYIKIKEHIAIMPFFRGLFCFIWYYPLYKHLHADNLKRHNKNELLVKPLAILFAIIYVLMILTSSADYMLTLQLLIIPLLLIPLANYINHTNTLKSPAYAYNSRWLIRHYILAFLFLPLVIFSIANDIKLLPSDKVIEGDYLWTHDIKFMQNLGAFPKDEKIILFYANDIISFRTDGNGFTEHRVFSYRENDNKRLSLESEEFVNIKGIDVNFSQHDTENTKIRVIRDNDSDFILYVSSEDELDKEFVRKLKERWLSFRNI